MRYLIAIDPANKTGFCYGMIDMKPTVKCVDFTPKKANKSRDAEPGYMRYGNFWLKLEELVFEARQAVSDVKNIEIIIENAEGFIRGKSAVEAAHSFRGVAKAFCAINGIKLHLIEPRDVKFFATKKASADKLEMIERAKIMYGYAGNNDNEADSLHIWHFLKEILNR